VEIYDDRHPVIVDAATLWPLASSAKGEGALATACEAIGIDHGIDNPIDGSQVFDAYMDGRDSEIIDHCAADVRDLASVWSVLCDVHGIGARQ
jgi:hypothetical protein